MPEMKIKDIAEELNTKSKRIIDKLEELKISGKGPMSKLTEDEVSKLYAYIGFIKPKKEEPAEKPQEEPKKEPAVRPVPQTEKTPAQHKGQYIIRRVENVVDTSREAAKKDPKKKYIVSSDDSGLLQGYTTSKTKYRKPQAELPVREPVRQEPIKEEKPVNKTEEAKPVAAVMPEPAQTAEKTSQQPVQTEMKTAQNQEKATEVSAETVKVKEPVKAAEPAATIEKKETVPTPDIKEEKPKEASAGNAIKQEEKKPEIAEPAPQKTESRPPSQQRTEYPRTERPSTGQQRTEYPRTDRPSTGQQRTEYPRTDRPSTGQQRTEYPRTDRPSTGQQRTEYPRTDRPSTGQQRTEYPRTDRPSTGQQRTEYPRTDRPSTGQQRTEYPRTDRPAQGQYPRTDRPSTGQQRPGYQAAERRPQDQPRTDGTRTTTDQPRRDYPRTDARPEYRRPFGEQKKDAEGRPIPPAYNRDRTQRPTRPDASVPFAKDKDDDKNSSRGARPVRKPQDAAASKPVLKPEKANDKKPGKKIEQQKMAKKEGATDTAKGKKATKPSEDIAVVDLKTTARLFSEDQVEKTGIADEKVLDFYSKATPRFKTRPKKGKPMKGARREIQKPSIPTEIKIDQAITVKEFAEMIKKTAGSVIIKLMNLGVMAAANDTIDFDTATLIAEEFGVKTVLKENVTEEDILFEDEAADEGKLVTRPPIVVVMGHVDHGKTSLLDAIKNTNIMDSEAGGITQHIGAYMVNVHGRDITFLDTPGHEAFTSLRARGAQVTDIAIIVVAADDGIMPQTVEAINHAKSAGVNIIVAINKIDKPDANIERIKQELTEYGLVTEEWGGDTICVPISAKLNQNIGELLDMVILSSDMLDLKADPDSQAKGTVIDASLDKNRGVIATLIVQRGTLKTGDSVVTGTTVGRIRAMTDYNGKPVNSAGPSTPVEIIGMPEVPLAGELFYAIHDQKLAKQLAEKRRVKQREDQMKKQNPVTLEDLFSKIKQGEIKDLNLIIKADVQGSVEALKQSLSRLGNEEVNVRIIHDAIGTITETDVSLAQVTGSILIGFNVRPSANITEAAEKAGVEIKLYNIIYEAIEDVEKALKGMLAPKFKEETLGHAEIRDTFKVSGIGTIAGCYVLDGKLTRNAKIRLVRNGIVVHTGELASLKRFKDDAREVNAGYECGTSVERFNDIKLGDIIEAYHIIEEVRT